MLGFNSTNEILKRHGHNDISEKEYHQGTRYHTPKRFAWHLNKDNADPQLGLEMGLEFDDLYIARVSVHSTPFYPGISSLLSAVQQASASPLLLSCLSNASTRYVSAVLSCNGASALFHSPLGADAVPSPKPSGLGLLHLCNLLGVAAEQAVYVGDAPGDGEAARKAGCKLSVGVTWGSYPAEELRGCGAFDLVVDDVEELKEALLGIVGGGD